MRKLALTLIAAAVATSASAQNLVTNGNFSAGLGGFASGYDYRAPTTGNNTAEGQYTVATNAFDWNTNFVSMADHTGGGGNFMVVNGSSTLGTVVYQSSVTGLTTGTSYFFEAFLANVCCNPGYTGQNFPPSLTFSVSLNGGPETSLGTLGLAIPPAVAGTWYGLSTSFNSGTATNATIFLRNAQTALEGNDFGLDDVFVGLQSTVVPEPATWAMMALGFGLVGAAFRRRQARPALA